MSGSWVERWRARRERETVYARPEFWDGKARTYRGSAISQWANPHLNEILHGEQTAVLAEWWPEVTGWSVLDVGCGTGRMSRHLAGRGARVTGMDFSEETLREARTLSGGEAVAWVQAGVPDWPEGGPWHGVLCCGVLTVACRDAVELETALRGLAERVESGGELVCIEPFHRGFLHRVLDLSVEEVEAVAASVGWSRVASRELHAWPLRWLLCHAVFPAWWTRLCWRLNPCFLRWWGMGDYAALRFQRVEPKEERKEGTGG